LCYGPPSMTKAQTPGQRIRQLREAECLTLEDVARMTDGAITAATLSRIESGEHTWPHAKTRKAIALALGVEPVFFWHPRERP
jgi:transcriptional regulator with XRE-family HTH domain